MPVLMAVRHLFLMKAPAPLLLRNGAEFQTIKLFLHFSQHKKRRISISLNLKVFSEGKTLFCQPKTQRHVLKIQQQEYYLYSWSAHWTGFAYFLAFSFASGPAGTVIDRAGNILAVTQVQGVG